MGKFIILTIAMILSYVFLSWKMEDKIGPIFIILILLGINYVASRFLNASKK